MDFIYLLGLLFLLYSLGVLILIFASDCDIVTFLYSRYGKQPDAEYKGKVVWITGASSGIGEAIAKELAKIGAKVVLSARRTEELERVKKECLSNSQLKEHDILVLPLDVTKLEAHEAAFQTVLKHFGKLDALLCNAGQPQAGKFTEIEMQVDKHIFDINVFAVVNMSRVVVKYFLEKGGGQVAVVSSLSGKMPSPLLAPYTGSKHAIHGYFHTLRMETFGKNIGVSIICPGPVDTPIFEKAVTNKAGEMATLPFPEGLKMMTPERCAYLTLLTMTNRISESWLAPLPIIPFTYMSIYCPGLSYLFLKFFGHKFVKQSMDQFVKTNKKD